MSKLKSFASSEIFAIIFLVKAFVSIEGKWAKILLLKGKDAEKGSIFTMEADELQRFLKAKHIKRIFLTFFFGGLLTLKVPLPPGVTYLKGKKLLKGIALSEIRKRYPQLQNCSFNLEIFEQEGKDWLYSYIVENSYFDFVNKLIIDGIEVEALYPLHLPLFELMKEKRLEEGKRIVCYACEDTRFLFVFNGKEMVFQRTFESKGRILREEDIFNINMTANYALQNLRIQIQEIVLIGAEEQEVLGLSLPYRFIQSEPFFEEHLICFLMSRFEKNLQGKGLFPNEYERFKKVRRYINITKAAFSTIALIFLFYNVFIFNDLKILRKDISFEKERLARKEREFHFLKQAVENYEKGLRPILELQNRKNSLPDIRQSFYFIAEASKMKSIYVNTLDVEKREKVKMKLGGQILGTSYLERQKTYSSFKSIIEKRGLRSLIESWDLIKGEFRIEGTYGT